jgi:hypothetical protein
MRHYYEHVFAWSEPVAVKINRNGRLLGSTAGKPTAGAVGSTATVRIPILACHGSRPLHHRLIGGQNPELTVAAVGIVGL